MSSAPDSTDTACSRHPLGSQFGHPRGVVGFLVGHLMAVKNRPMNRAVADALEVAPTDRILEIGFGPGDLIEVLASRACDGFVAGVDPSAEMVRQARRRNGGWIRTGRVDPRAGAVPGLPFEDGAFTKAVAVNVVHHIDDTDAAFADLLRVLSPGGTLLVAIRLALSGRQALRSPGLTPAQVDRVARRMSVAGFAVDVTRVVAGREIALVRGRRAAA